MFVKNSPNVSDISFLSEVIWLSEVFNSVIVSLSFILFDSELIVSWVYDVMGSILENGIQVNSLVKCHEYLVKRTFMIDWKDRIFGLTVPLKGH